ncbi:MAG: hypothetical protein IPL75_13875 [Acidobacteria bacterium]|nr:hypothetical protein [Acidobacteriota bacterium]
MEATIAALVRGRQQRLTKMPPWRAFFGLQSGLNTGDIRAAEPDRASPTGWRVTCG